MIGPLLIAAQAFGYAVCPNDAPLKAEDYQALLDAPIETELRLGFLDGDRALFWKGDEGKETAFIELEWTCEDGFCLWSKNDIEFYIPEGPPTEQWCYQGNEYNVVKQDGVNRTIVQRRYGKVESLFRIRPARGITDYVPAEPALTFKKLDEPEENAEIVLPEQRPLGFRIKPGPTPPSDDE
ncbi:hypothetical protein HK107_06980 [Parvularcula sp. ZS-1/3]|uniref:Uncharacterized protein n=1 Tax=Parvularcula mediterranea TaxID=2732508 RepID=A0A7Y3RL42_9PROT|nr:hypothetical protein [Parvularcula mediterranea]NNU16063.1 hypothetical protein [Parvularcula mediterranea]